MKTLVIAKTASIADSSVVEGDDRFPTSIGENTIVGDFVRIYPGVQIGNNCIIGDHCILGHPSKANLTGRDDSSYSDKVRDKLVASPYTVIADNSIVRSHSIIYRSVNIGKRFQSGHHISIREHTTIGDKVVFGSYASCDGFTVIGSGTQIGQYVMLAQAAEVGNNCFVGGHTVFSDNKYVIRKVEFDLNGAVIEDYVRIGLNCCLFPGVRVGRNSILGMGSLVNNSIPQNTMAFGSPAKIVRELDKAEISLYIDSCPTET